MGLPNGYTQLEWIEASGGQYIDSLVSGALPVRVVLKMRSGTGMATTDSVMVGMYQSSKMVTPIYLYKSTWFVSCGSSDGASASGTLVDSTDYEVVSELTSTYFKCTVNGTVLINKTANSTGGTNTLYLFARNDNGTATRFANGRIYSCQIFGNNTLVRDFIPARRNSDGAIGLLDQANNVFYGNAGTGTFVAGPEIVSTGSLANIDGTSVLLAGCLANVGGIEYAIPYALANVDGIEVVVPFGGSVGERFTLTITDTTPPGEDNLTSVSVGAQTINASDLATDESVVIDVGYGDQLTVTIGNTNYSTKEIHVNGTVVASGASGKVEYEMAIESNIDIELYGRLVAGWYVYITTS